MPNFHIVNDVGADMDLLHALPRGLYVLSAHDRTRVLLPDNGADEIPVTVVDDFSKQADKWPEGIYLGTPILNAKTRAVTFL